MTKNAPAPRIEMAALLLAGVTLSSLLSGCVSTSPSPSLTEPASDVVTVPPFDRPSPPPSEISDAELDALRVQNQDEFWSTVIGLYPTAIRPEVEFRGYVADADRLAALTTCYEATGLPIATATGTDGTPQSVSVGMETEEAALTWYSCESANPSRPTPPANAEQLAWLYGYLTEFLAPCYEANGYDIPPPPSESEFVTKWPNQGWYPTIDDRIPNRERDAALSSACPAPA